MDQISIDTQLEVGDWIGEYEEGENRISVIWKIRSIHGGRIGMDDFLTVLHPRLRPTMWTDLERIRPPEYKRIFMEGMPEEEQDKILGIKIKSGSRS